MTFDGIEMKKVGQVHYLDSFSFDGKNISKAKILKIQKNGEIAHKHKSSITEKYKELI